MNEDVSRESFYSKYPNFDEVEAKSNKFSGNLKIKDKWVQVNIYLPKFPRMEDSKCLIFKGADRVEYNADAVNPEWDVQKFFEELPRLIIFENDDTISFSQIEKNILNFKNQIKHMKSDKFRTFISHDLSNIKFSHFSGYENHFLEILVTKNFTFDVGSHSLPETGESLFKTCSTIEAYLSQFWRLLEQFEDFYGNMNSIDELCYVVEPPEIDTKCDWRIVKLTDKVYMKIVVSPLSPSSITVNFIGPTVEVAKYREMYNEKLDDWDVDLDIYRNLLRIFDLLRFPMKGSQSDEEYCNICYCYMLDNHVPIISCDNSRCSLIYHATCLKQWFAALKDGKTYLNVTLGSCPYCQEKLSTSFTQLFEM